MYSRNFDVNLDVKLSRTRLDFSSFLYSVSFHTETEVECVVKFNLCNLGLYFVWNITFALGGKTSSCFCSRLQYHWWKEINKQSFRLRFISLLISTAGKDLISQFDKCISFSLWPWIAKLFIVLELNLQDELFETVFKIYFFNVNILRKDSVNHFELLLNGVTFSNMKSRLSRATFAEFLFKKVLF